MISTTLSTKGQIVIPLDLRRKLGLGAGDKLLCAIEGGKIVLTLEPRESATRRIADDGLPVLTAPAGAPPMTPELVKEILAE
ncbi:MAG: AbrB/MazE/SpoVT family DNA-binding domain-containing protein [Verrucomicrobiota bacterium]